MGPRRMRDYFGGIWLRGPPKTRGPPAPSTSRIGNYARRVARPAGTSFLDRNLERRERSRQVLGSQPGARSLPVLRSELEVSVPRPVRQHLEDLVHVREGVEPMKTAADVPARRFLGAGQAGGQVRGHRMRFPDGGHGAEPDDTVS